MLSELFQTTGQLFGLIGELGASVLFLVLLVAGAYTVGKIIRGKK